MPHSHRPTILSQQSLTSQTAKLALNFSRTKRFDEFSLKMSFPILRPKLHFRKSSFWIPRVKHVELYHQYWRTEKANLPLSADVIRSIENHIADRPYCLTVRPQSSMFLGLDGTSAVSDKHLIPSP